MPPLTGGGVSVLVPGVGLGVSEVPGVGSVDGSGVVDSPGSGDVVGAGVSLPVGVGVGSLVPVGVGVGVGVGLPEGDGVGLGVGVGDPLGDGLGDSVASALVIPTTYCWSVTPSWAITLMTFILSPTLRLIVPVPVTSALGSCGYASRFTDSVS